MTTTTPEHSSAATVLAGELRRRILAGEWRAGERLLQEDLARIFNVSRQPVREALAELVREGLLIRTASRSVKIFDPDVTEIAENYQMRRLLEGELASQAANSRTSSELEHLKGINERQRQATVRAEFTTVSELNAEFHHTLHEMAKRPLTASVVKRLWAGWMFASPLFGEARALASCDEHERVIRAISNSDPEAARTAMASHITAGEETLKHLRAAQAEAKQVNGRNQ